MGFRGFNMFQFQGLANDVAPDQFWMNPDPTAPEVRFRKQGS